MTGGDGAEFPAKEVSARSGVPRTHKAGLSEHVLCSSGSAGEGLKITFTFPGFLLRKARNSGFGIGIASLVSK